MKTTIIGILCIMLLLTGCVVEDQEKEVIEEVEVEQIEEVELVIDMPTLVKGILEAQGFNVIEVKEMTGDTGKSMATATLIVSDDITENEILLTLGYTTGVLYEGFDSERIATGMVTMGEWCIFVIDSEKVGLYVNQQIDDIEFLSSFTTECGDVK